MTNFLELAKSRYSARGYSDQEIEPDTLQYILEAAQAAPSAANFQPWHLVVIRDGNIRKEINSVYSRPWFAQAPILLIICGDHEKSWKRADGKDHCDIDIAIITDHITLAAAEKGIGTCWICNFDALLCRNILQLPDHIEPIVILTIGYPDKNQDLSRHTKRKNLDEFIHYERF